MRMVLLAAVGLAGCSIYGAGSHYACASDADCADTPYPQCVDKVCEAPGRTTATGSTSTTATGTTGMTGTTGASTGTSGSATGATSSSGGTSGLSATLSIAPGLVGGAIRQLTLVDAGIVALGASLWERQPGDGAWTEILDTPGDSLLGHYTEAAASQQTGFNNQFDGFRLAAFAATNDVWLISADSELVGLLNTSTGPVVPNLQDGGVAALQLNNIFGVCQTTNCTDLGWLPGWYPVRQEGALIFPDPAQLTNGGPVLDLVVNSATGFSMLTLDDYDLPFRDLNFAEIYRTTDLAPSDTAPNVQKYYSTCAHAFSLPEGPFFQTTLVDGGWVLQTFGFIDGGPTNGVIYDVTNSESFPVGYAPVPQVATSGCPGLAAPAIAVAADGGTAIYVAGGQPGGTAETVWAFLNGNARSILTATAGGPIVMQVGPAPDGGNPVLWISDGPMLYTAPLLSGSAQPLGEIPSTLGSVTSLAAFGGRMLAGTSNGVFDVTVPASAGALDGNAGLDGLELDAFAQTAGATYVLAGAAGSAPELLIIDDGGPRPFSRIGRGQCTALAPVSTNLILVACDGGVEVESEGSSTDLTGFVPQGSFAAAGDSSADTLYSGDVGQPVAWALVVNPSFDVIDGGPLLTDAGAVLGPVWSSPLVGDAGSAVYANVAGGGFALLQGGPKALWLQATGAQSSSLPGAVDPTDGTRFELPAFVDAGSTFLSPELGFTLQECMVDGGAVACVPLCQIAPQPANLTLDLSFDGAGNLWALSHLAASDPFETIRDDTSSLYFVTKAARLAAGDSSASCPQVALTLASPNGQGDAGYSEGVLGLGVALFDGGAIYLRGTRHPLVLSQP